MIYGNYEIYRLIPTEANKSLQFRPYRFLTENSIKVRSENYEVAFKGDLTEDLTVKELREQLESEKPPDSEGKKIRISDVLAVTRNGITAAYYVDPTKLILIPDFFHESGSSVLITIDSDNLPLDGRKGSWMTVDTLRINGQNLLLMQSKDYGRDVPYVIVDEYGKELAADKAGFSETVIEQIRNSLKEVNAKLAVEASLAPDKKPKLEVWQQYFENGEYLRAAEITEEQNYNMIDGTMNNRAPKRSVLERLQEKQFTLNNSSISERFPEARNAEDLERDRK